MKMIGLLIHLEDYTPTFLMKYFDAWELLEKFDAGASIAMIEYWIIAGRIE